MEELNMYESVKADLAKCGAKLGYRPIWVIAEINNMKDRVVNVKRVKSLPVFMGC